MKTTINKILYSFIFITLLESCSGFRNASNPGEVGPPSWAPPYESNVEVHYYYLPDLEVYYDVWRQEYIYLQNGRWIFSSTLPPGYYNYDLNNAFVIFLDSRVKQPWRHHGFYNSQYPPYYYEKKFPDGKRRGVDENIRNRDSERRYPYPPNDQDNRRDVNRRSGQEQNRDNSSDRGRNYEPSGRTDGREENKSPDREDSRSGSSGGRR